MVLTDLDFERLLKDALTTKEEPSKILNTKLKNKINERKSGVKSIKYLKTAAACVIVILTSATILVNSSQNAANTLGSLPIIGSVSNALIFRDYTAELSESYAFEDDSSENKDDVNSDTVNFSMITKQTSTDEIVASSEETENINDVSKEKSSQNKSNSIKASNNVKDEQNSTSKPDNEVKTNSKKLINELLGKTEAVENTEIAMKKMEESTGLNLSINEEASSFKLGRSAVAAGGGGASPEGASVADVLQMASVEADTAAYSQSDIGIEMTAENVTSTGLTVVFEQNGGSITGELNTGTPYYLEKYEEEQWNGVAQLPQQHDIAWNSNSYIINENSKTELDVDWEWLYGNLSEGKYRIGKEIMDFRAPGDYDTHTYYAEFEITE